MRLEIFRSVSYEAKYVGLSDTYGFMCPCSDCGPSRRGRIQRCRVRFSPVGPTRRSVSPFRLNTRQMTISISKVKSILGYCEYSTCLKVELSFLVLTACACFCLHRMKAKTRPQRAMPPSAAPTIGPTIGFRGEVLD